MLVIHQELEQMIEELKDVNQITTREQLNAYLERANQTINVLRSFIGDEN